MVLTAGERQEINDLARQFGAATGIRAVTAVVGRADDYPDIPWRAFALGAALAALAVGADEFLRPLWSDWDHSHGPLRDVTAVLAAGAIACVAAMFWPALGRLLLNRQRAGAETRQYAEGLFLRHEVFAAPARNGLLIMVARFERRVIILPDQGLRQHISLAELDGVVAAMTPHLGNSRPAAAFRAGFDALRMLLRTKGVPVQHGDDAPAAGAVIEEGV